MQLKKTKTKTYDNLRHALQAPFGHHKRRVLWLVDRKEKRSPWLYKQEHAQRLYKLVKQKYGQAIISLD